jgi:hypothetical protein
MPGLAHQEVFTDASGVATTLPLGDELGPLGGGARFPLIEDPRVTRRASLVGMFVLRPAEVAWNEPLLDGGVPRSLFAARDWCFNVRGVDGGWLIAGGNPLDAYRLALQYGLSDAVIVGSNTVAKEGVDHGGQPGYLWQPYGPAAWPHLAAIDAHLAEKIGRVRAAWQQQGVLSARRYPAQVVVSQSGEHRPPAADIFDARVFHASHPDGSPVEAYVLTSERGAERMRPRAVARGLRRVDELFVVASPPGRPEELDIAAVPALLFERLGIRVANHDGGATVLSKFSEAGALPQVNLTLMRGRSVREVLAASDRLDAAARDRVLAEFAQRRQLFFSGDHRLPGVLRPVSVLSDGGDGVVVAFDARGLRGL